MTFSAVGKSARSASGNRLLRGTVRRDLQQPVGDEVALRAAY